MILLVHLLWSGVAAYAIWRISQVVELFAPSSTASGEEVVLPEDLIAYAMSFTEPWAQEDCLKAIRQSHEKWKDWNRVRAAMGIGRLES